MVKSAPRVSVLVPVYNVEKYLPECLESIINQTLKEIEIICIDDGSTDSSGRICDEYAKKDKRIKVIHKQNSGYGASMNAGLDSASGEYIGIVESDDYIEPEMYAEQYALAKQKDIDVLKADFKRFVGDGIYRKFTDSKIDTKFKYYNKIIKPVKQWQAYNTYIVIWTGIYKREFLVKNKIRFNETSGASYQDNGFYFQTYTLAEHLYIMDKSYYRLRRDNPNSSVKNKAKVFCICDEYDFIKEFVRKHSELPEEIQAMQYYKRYQNYLWNYNRIAEEYKLSFLERFASDFRNAQNYLSSPVFTKSSRLEIKQIIKDYRKYYIAYCERRRKKYASDLVSWYQRVTHKKLDLDNPQTFNEKIQWLKLYDATPIKTKLADKYLVREWVKEKIGEEYLVPLLGVYDNADDIDFDKLPNKFVLKCNHGSGWNIIVSDKTKLDVSDARNKLNIWMNDCYAFKAGCELHYRNIKPKIIVEKFIENKGTNDLYDYKFWCFQGKVQYIQFLSERYLDGLKMAFYDEEWNKQKFVYSYPLDKKNMPCPKNLNKMIKLAEKLSKEFNHTRVDFYRLNDGTIYFGEITFTYASGGMKWSDEQINLKLGQMIRLPEQAYDMDTGEYYRLPKDFHKSIKVERKEITTYKLFNFIPVMKVKRREGRKVWKICGLPVFKIRRMANGITTKYYFCGLPILKVSEK